MTLVESVKSVKRVEIEQSWTDLYGGACALLRGDYGGGTLLLACTLEHSSAVLEGVAQLPAFKGNLFLCVWNEAWRVPLERAVLEFSPRATFLVSSETPQAQTVQIESGLNFLEDGRGWQNLSFDALECAPETLIQTFAVELERRGWLVLAQVSP